jgi:hypothetical protein
VFLYLDTLTLVFGVAVAHILAREVETEAWVMTCSQIVSLLLHPPQTDCWPVASKWSLGLGAEHLLNFEEVTPFPTSRTYSKQKRILIESQRMKRRMKMQTLTLLHSTSSSTPQPGLALEQELESCEKE